MSAHKDYLLKRVHELEIQVESLESQLAAREWISVSERLPEKHGHYLVYHIGSMGVGWFTELSNGKSGFRHIGISPTHWQHLPPPPAQEDGE